MARANPSRQKWITVAEQLRQVRRAHLLFLDRWAVAQLATGRGLSQVAHDLHQENKLAGPLAGPDTNDWSLLYRGSILDD